MMTNATLLPRNANAVERALEQATARIGDVPVPLHELWDPWTCPIDQLPWLAWALSTDRWEVDWSEDKKRQTVADAIDMQRHKGTPASVEAVLASFDSLLTLTEWFEVGGTPHTFGINLPLISANGDLGGYRSSAQFADAIIRDVWSAKPARSHFILTQSLEGFATIDVVGAGRTAGYRRADMLADTATASQTWWDLVLTTEDGEPLELEPASPGLFLEVESNLATAEDDSPILAEDGSKIVME